MKQLKGQARARGQKRNPLRDQPCNPGLGGGGVLGLQKMGGSGKKTYMGKNSWKKRRRRSKITLSYEQKALALSEAVLTTPSFELLPTLFYPLKIKPSQK